MLTFCQDIGFIDPYKNFLSTQPQVILILNQTNRHSTLLIGQLGGLRKIDRRKIISFNIKWYYYTSRGYANRYDTMCEHLKRSIIRTRNNFNRYFENEERPLIKQVLISDVGPYFVTRAPESLNRKYFDLRLKRKSFQTSREKFLVGLICIAQEGLFNWFIVSS